LPRIRRHRSSPYNYQPNTEYYCTIADRMAVSKDVKQLITDAGHIQKNQLGFYEIVYLINEKEIDNNGEILRLLWLAIVSLF